MSEIEQFLHDDGPCGSPRRGPRRGSSHTSVWWHGTLYDITENVTAGVGASV